MHMKRLTEQGVKVTREEKVSLMAQWAEEYRPLLAEQIAELQLTASSWRAQKRRCVEALQDQASLRGAEGHHVQAGGSGHVFSGLAIGS